MSYLVSSENKVPFLFLASLKVDGVYYFKDEDQYFFQLERPAWHYKRSFVDHGISAFSFASKPNVFQPDGFLAVNRIRRTTLEIDFKRSYEATPELAQEDVHLLVFRRNANVLRYVGGSAYVVYS